MAADYAKCAKEILDTVGGRANLVSAAHCATRLRLVTVDNSRIDMKKLENIDGVKGVFSNNGQLQLIIGTGTVNKVYDEFIAISGISAATREGGSDAPSARYSRTERSRRTQRTSRYPSSRAYARRSPQRSGPVILRAWLPQSSPEVPARCSGCGSWRSSE